MSSINPLSEQINESDMLDLVIAGPLTTRDEVADFLDGTAEERALILSNVQLQGMAPVVTDWDRFVSILGAAMSVAGVVTGISTAITSAYAVKAVL